MLCVHRVWVRPKEIYKIKYSSILNSIAVLSSMNYERYNEDKLGRPYVERLGLACIADLNDRVQIVISIMLGFLS